MCSHSRCGRKRSLNNTMCILYILYIRVQTQMKCRLEREREREIFTGSLYPLADQRIYTYYMFFRVNLSIYRKNPKGAGVLSQKIEDTWMSNFYLYCVFLSPLTRTAKCLILSRS
jgi:hypothetical protein